tara:strand:- start:15505 stop:15648 length:144 start_codon:yes stop_codon:yes gene_type:complete
MGITILIAVLWVTYMLGKYAFKQGVQLERNKIKQNIEQWEKKNKKTS